MHCTILIMIHHATDMPIEYPNYNIINNYYGSCNGNYYDDGTVAVPLFCL